MKEKYLIQHSKAPMVTPVKNNEVVAEDKESSSFGPSDSTSSLEESITDEAAGVSGESTVSGPSESVSQDAHGDATTDVTTDVPVDDEDGAADVSHITSGSKGQVTVNVEQELYGGEPSRPVQALESEVSLESRVAQDALENEALNSTASPTLEGLSGHNPYSPDPSFYVSLCQNDVYLALRFLSGMSISTTGKPGIAETDAVVSSAFSIDQLSPVALKARLLALEMLLSIFANAGPFLASSQNQSVILIAKQYICFAISKNAMGTNPDLFELAMSLFLMVLRFYLPSLKHEMGVLLNSVFLHLLEMDNSSYKQKNVILQGLLKICETSQVFMLDGVDRTFRL
jgi:brefeldin A-inhibited guanine nucleotide-exchange protein